MAQTQYFLIDAALSRRTQISGRPQKPILVSSQAIEQLYELVPGWEKYMLEHNYIAWAKTLEPARNEDARFLCWV
jgi:hypothetical protein